MRGCLQHFKYADVNDKHKSDIPSWRTQKNKMFIFYFHKQKICKKEFEMLYVKLYTFSEACPNKCMCLHFRRLRLWTKAVDQKLSSAIYVQICFLQNAFKLQPIYLQSFYKILSNYNHNYLPLIHCRTSKFLQNAFKPQP